MKSSENNKSLTLTFFLYQNGAKNKKATQEYTNHSKRYIKPTEILLQICIVCTLTEMRKTSYPYAKKKVGHHTLYKKSLWPIMNALCI